MKTGIHLVRNINVIGIISFVCLLWLSSTVTLKGQPNPTASVDDLGQKATQKQSTTIRVAVDEVRVDAVVLDWRGHQMTDLTAGDFEIYQDGKKQEIASCTYVNDFKSSPDPNRYSTSAPAPSRDEIRRTILFLVDDFNMSFVNIYYTRMALNNFVNKQMQPGDLVGIFQTSNGFGQPFSTDKRQLLPIIEKIQSGAPQLDIQCASGG